MLQSSHTVIATVETTNHSIALPRCLLYIRLHCLGIKFHSDTLKLFNKISSPFLYTKSFGDVHFSHSAEDIPFIFRFLLSNKKVPTCIWQACRTSIISIDFPLKPNPRKHELWCNFLARSYLDLAISLEILILLPDQYFFTCTKS